MIICGAASYTHLAHQGVAPHTSMANGGGGGAPEPKDTRYANLDALYGTQNQASQFMLDNAMPYIPALTQNSETMVNDAMSGTLANRARDMAGADASQALSDGLAAVNRNMARYGSEMNAGRMQKSAQDAALGGALNKATAMNKAGQWAEDQKWNRNANFYGQVMGMNNGAMQGMNSAGAGLSNIANQQNANDRANAAGFGQAGAAFGSALFKADGGIVAPKMATGGDAWTAYKKANPVRPYSGPGGGHTNGVSAFIRGAAPILVGAGLRDILNLDGKGGKIVKAAKDGYAKVMTPAQTSAATAATQGSDAAAVSGLNPEMATGMSDVATTATTAADVATAADGAAAATTAADGATAATTAADAATAADSASTAAAAADGASAAAEGSSWLDLFLADGGGVKLAMGGMPTLKKMSVADDANVAGLDSSSSLQISKMDDVKKANSNRPAAAGYQGKTDGMGETSSGDPDGFGKESGDNRHIAGTMVLKGVGNYIFPGLGTLLGDTVADAIHPVMEKATRNVIVAGDTLGRATLGGSDAAGFAGAFGLDPVGTVLSGKYFSEGGLNDVQREDFTPGGAVTGPGSGTSDEVPAWLSNGEHVQNAVSTRLAGQDTLDAINDAGLEVRQGKASPTQAKRKIGKAMVERGLELTQDKPGVKMAGGGFLGVAMGAGVDQYNRERQLASQEAATELARNADARAAEMQPLQVENARTRNEITGLAAAQGRREGEVAEKEQGLKLGTIEDRYALAKQDFRNKMAAGKLTDMQIGKELLGAWAEADDALANRMLKDDDWKAGTRIADASYVKGSRGDIDLTFDDGTQWRTSKQAIKNWRQGNEPLKMQVIGEGGMGVLTDRRGKVVDTIKNPKAPDGTKNDAAMDDAAGIMASVLDANKTMMTQFGGRETEIRQGAVLLHNQGIGEFKETYGRAPNRREAARIAEQALKVAAQRTGQK